MKTALLFLLCVIASFAAETVNLSEPVPRIRLADGRILQKVVFVSFKPLDVFVRYTGGSISLRYEALPDDIRAAAEQKRPGGPRWYPGEAAEKLVQVEGQVFVQTRGQGPYKFGEAKVYAFSADQLDAWKRVSFDDVVKLAKALARATTDGDGRFKIGVPKDTPYFLFCQTSRMFSDGTMEHNEWRVPGEQFKNPKEAVLTGNNQADSFSRVEIEETP